MSETAQQLDTTGTVCPLPILLTAKAMMGLAPGETLEVVGDDPAIADDMPIYCFRSGNLLLELTEEGQTVRCRIAKGDH